MTIRRRRWLEIAAAATAGAASARLAGAQAWPARPIRLVASIAHLRSGALRALGVTTAARIAVLPDAPPVADTVPGYEARGWFGVGAPKGAPADIVDRLAREINLGLADPEVGARIGDLGSSPLSMSSAEFGAFMAAETEKWAKVVKLSGAKPD